MTWAAQVNDTNLFECTHFTLEGNEWVGSAYWWFILKRIENAQEKCMVWPPFGSQLRKQMGEFAIANAALLGAEFEQTDRGWAIRNRHLALGFHTDQAEVACAFLSTVHSYWVAYNKQKTEWELISQ